MTEDEDGESSAAGFDFELGGMLEGLAELAESLEEVAEAGADVESVRDLDAEEGDLDGVVGFRFRTDIGETDSAEQSTESDRGFTVDPFGNVEKNQETGDVEVKSVREPMVDVFDEDDHVLVIAEMPGVEVEDVQIAVDGDVLRLKAARGERRYETELLLPRPFEREDAEISGNSGVLEIRFQHTS